MKTMKLMKGVMAIAGSAALGLTIATVAQAANPEPVPVEVEFVNPIQITEQNALQFGLVDVNLANNE